MNNSCVIEKGYAKINLSLDVTGRLENGYHLVKMIMISLSLFDEIKIERTDKPGIYIVGDDNSQIDIKGLSLGEDNLIYKAAKAILTKERLEKKGVNPEELGLKLTLLKNIPMAAGMAGGSADAAATLRGLNRFFDFNLSAQELCEMGVKLGADVPFCVLQGCYLSEGIGEVLTKLPDPNDTLTNKVYIALIKPPIDVSTKFVYEHLDTEGVDIHPDVDAQIKAIQDGNLEGIAKYMRNVLRDVTVPAYPIVLELEEFLKENGAINAMMTGSGSTVFGIYDNKEKCQAAIELAKEKYPDMFAECGEFV